MTAMRIVSFLPSATEMICALGLEDSLVGITHECDCPPSIRDRPVVVRAALKTGTMSPGEIDHAVRARLQAGQSLYEVDEVKLRALAPDLIVTQDLCQVCAPSGNEATRAVAALAKKPQVLFLTPKCLDDIFMNILEVGAAAGVATRSEALVRDLRVRVESYRLRSTAVACRPRVFILEWFDPPYNSGHWMGELVALAGGEDRLASVGTDSVRVAWEQVTAYAPEVLICAPCGYDLDGAVREAQALRRMPGWADLPAVRQGAVFAVDASAFFARPGPRVVDGIGILAEILHPDCFAGEAPAGSYRRLD